MYCVAQTFLAIVDWKSVAAKMHPPQIRWEPAESNKMNRDKLAGLGTNIYDVIQELLLLMLLRFRQQAVQSSEKKVVGFTLDYIHFEKSVRKLPIVAPLTCPVLTKFWRYRISGSAHLTKII
jgi:hypothetical protein